MQSTGTLPVIGPGPRIRPIDELPLPVSRLGTSYRPGPKRKTVRHYPQTLMNGRCVRLVPCDEVDRLESIARSLVR